MINLVIDIGNTRTKVALFNNHQISGLNIFESFTAKVLAEILKVNKIDRAIISSVNAEITELEEYLKTEVSYIRFHSGVPLKINNQYKTPATLGLDRLAAVIGAEALYPGRNVLIIDAGTCITYDFIDKDKKYSGGSISPGIEMRLKAMHHFTQRLPLVEPDFTFESGWGDETRSAILSGAQNGVFYESLGFIKSYSEKYSDLEVILCGGDSKFFDTRLKNSIFAPAVKSEPHLVLIGLNEVIHQHTND
ncbi:type III pantothenate kinase [Rubrolithibacter danxiaensis]|uniref:type III pantothenate kinase n=1 Tax=Rubrolithibacter danxiaensis TaxID=3390805 RepID=UPI003BF7F86C